MPTPTLYDLAPTLHLMLMGLVLALGPLAWIWLRHRQAGTLRRLQVLTWFTLFLTFDLVMFGAFTRLTDSGLGCPDWPGCYGKASPVGAHAEISAAQQAMPTGPVTSSKAWIEMIHRYLATAVGVLIVVLAISSWIASRHRSSTDSVKPRLGWALFTLLWVCVQGAFGALTVTMKLFPAIVTMHLLGGLALLALLTVQAAHLSPSTQIIASADKPPMSKNLRAGLWLVLGLVVLQCALGGWVSTNYAVLACRDFPSCQGSWWPAMNFAQGFQIWRELGLTSDGTPIQFTALTAIHYTHRLAAYAVLAALAILAWRLYRTGQWLIAARWLSILALLQFLTGLSNVVLGWPLLAAVLHTGGAAAFIIVLTWLIAASSGLAGAKR